MQDRLPALALAAVTLVLAGHALAIQVPAHKTALFSDEATYHSMAWSLAFDGDLRYQLRDLHRVYELGYDAGPTGIFLKHDPATGEVTYAKAFIYSLVAAPFVRWLGDSGFFLLHALLFGLVMAAGYAYLRRVSGAALAAACTLTYFVASVVFLYQFWITPEWFNLSMGFLATFLWLYKLPPPGWPDDVPWEASGWLSGAWTDVGAAVLYGVAAYSKPPSVILAAPMLLWIVWRRRPVRAVALGLVTVAVIVALFGATQAISGDWNYMGGERRSFHGPYPFQSRLDTFETIPGGTPMVTELADYADRIPDPELLAADLVYLWVGRNGGLLVYMFPAVAALLAFAAGVQRRASGPWLLLVGAFFVSALAYMTVIQTNWIGGGGTVGARYFVPFYFVPFFLIPAGAGLAGVVASWGVAALFLGQILLHPFSSSFDPARHTKAFPYRLLPAELTMLNDLPFNVHPSARRVDFGQDDFDVYFLDDGTWGREAGTWGFWVVGGREAEVVVRAAGVLEEVVLEVEPGPVDNRVRATLDGHEAVAELEAGSTVTLRLPAGRGFPYGDSRVYRMTVEARGGFIPLFDEAGATDTRLLGVFVRPSVVLVGEDAAVGQR